MDLTAVAILGSIFSAAILVLALRNLHARRERNSTFGDPADQPRRFEAGDYAPMKRLFSAEDVSFLRSQPGFRPDMEGRFRKQRRAIFHLYLRRLESDYRRLSGALRELIVSAPEDQSALLAELARQDWLFRIGILRLRLSIVLHALRLAPAPGATDALVEAAARLNAMLQTLAPATALEASA